MAVMINAMRRRCVTRPMGFKVLRRTVVANPKVKREKTAPITAFQTWQMF